VNRTATNYFNVGDVILYGRWKNKRGLVVRLFTDDRGVPMVEIEPVPKGRKKNKTFSLFKIWHAPEVEKEAMKTAARIVSRFEGEATASRVASRFLQAGRGETVVRGNVRVHQYATSIRVWDLTNAGKRGKTCRVMSVAPDYKYPGDSEKWAESMGKAIEDYDSYDRIKAFFSDVLHDFPGEIRIMEDTLRGVDVVPADLKKIKVTWTKGDDEYELGALPTGFTLRHTVTFKDQGEKKDNTFKQDTHYYPRGKSDASVFYNWAVANESEIKRMDLRAFIKLFHDDLKIKYDTW
jgi:hypothetical protein